MPHSESSDDTHTREHARQGSDRFHRHDHFVAGYADIAVDVGPLFQWLRQTPFTFVQSHFACLCVSASARIRFVVIAY